MTEAAGQQEAERGMERPLRSYAWFQALRALPFVNAIWLFGSRARGYAWDRSDIDIAIHCPRAENCDWQRVLDIVEEEADTLLKIDAVRFDTLGEGDELRHNRTEAHRGVPAMTEGELNVSHRTHCWGERWIDWAKSWRGVRPAIRCCAMQPSSGLNSVPN